MTDRDPYEPHDDDVELFVCEDCIGEALLKEEIATRGEARTCMSCRNEETMAVSLAGLARRVVQVYESMVGFAELEPEFEADSDRIRWVQRGSSPSALIAELIEAADDRIAEAIVEHLSEVNGYAVARDGEICMTTHLRP